jgi:hypothetical protein
MTPIERKPLDGCVILCGSNLLQREPKLRPGLDGQLDVTGIAGKYFDREVPHEGLDANVTRPVPLLRGGVAAGDVFAGGGGDDSGRDGVVPTVVDVVSRLKTFFLATFVFVLILGQKIMKRGAYERPK